MKGSIMDILVAVILGMVSTLLALAYFDVLFF
jgi:hypothetical protein